VCLAAACLLALGACGMFQAGVEKRAAEYYSFQLGYLPKAKYSSFLSPAYRALAKPETLSQLDEGIRAKSSPSKRYRKIKADQVTALQDGSFALTLADPALGGTFRDGKPLRWVRDGRQWYIYLGSDAEAQKYGVFPASLEDQALNARRPSSAPPLLEHSQAPPAASEPPAAATGADEGSEPPAASEAAPPAEGGSAPPAEGGEAPAEPGAGKDGGGKQGGAGAKSGK
jgi:hypothetical protein